MDKRIKINKLRWAGHVKRIDKDDIVNVIK